MRNPEEAWTDVERDLFYAKQRIMELESERTALQHDLRYYENTLFLEGSRTAVYRGSDVATIDPEKVGDIVCSNRRLKIAVAWLAAR